MTQLFTKDGVSVPGTVIKAGPCVVVQAKTAATDGYEAVQIGLVEEQAGEGAQAAGGALQEGRRAADPRAPRGDSWPRAPKRRRRAIRCSSPACSPTAIAST